MTTLTVTATEGGSTANGIGLRVYVITGAKNVAGQTGGSANAQISGSTAVTASITTSSGSNVYGGASTTGASGDTQTGSNATVADHVFDNTDSVWLVNFHALNVTAGATTRGYTNSSAVSGPLALLEILPAGTLAEDGSGPVFVSASALTVTTASFTPPAGSLLVAITSSNGGAAQTTMSVTDNLGSHLNWTEKVKNNPNGGDYSGVWIADVPAGGAPLLRQTRLRMFRQALLGGVAPVAGGPAGTIQPQPTFPTPRRRLLRAVIASGQGTRAPQGTVQPPPTLTPPRRKLSRAVVRSGTGRIAPTGTVQPPPTLTPPRRKLARASVQFTPVTTTNQAAAAVPAGTIQPSPTLTWPRRKLARSTVQFTPVRTTNAVLPPPVFTLPPGGSTEGELWRMYRDNDWPKRPPGFGPVGEVPSSGTPREQASGRGWVGKKVRRFFWPREED